MAQSTWTSLEITKLVIGGLTPLILLFLGIWVNRIIKRIEAAQWANQKLIEKRIAIYDELAPLVNDLYCYYLCVGNYKELTPAQIVDIKRKLDKKVYIYAALFSSEFIDSYNEFIHLCFQTYVGAGHNAKLRTAIKHPTGGDRTKVSSFPWQEEWNHIFSNGEDCCPLTQTRISYENLMSRFSNELGVGLESGKHGRRKDVRQPKSQDRVEVAERGGT
ncbi:MAG: hypothetical protein H7Z75_01475 [Ferruginibacter sp.]|nr:hypothetical protein [Cytophagales bacterium]